MATNITIVEQRHGLIPVDWKELWDYRELLLLLAWRDIKVRYKQTALGASWAILQPLLNMLIFTLLFNRLAHMPSDGLPYPLFVLAGLLPWTFFANSVGTSAQSLVGSAHLITRVYFPRLIVVLSSVLSGLLDLGITFLLMFGIMAFYHVRVGWALLLLPFLVLITSLTAFGIGTGIAALTVAYRDFRYVVPFAVQVGMFITPVVYPVSVIPQRWRWLVNLNPMAGIIEAYRSSFFSTPLPWGEFSLSLCSGAVLFFIGTAYFRKVERGFADII
jgi:lipopolysaccharide transport system permease protein